MSTPEADRCWICRVSEANAGEHLIKHSDLKAVFGPARNQRFYFHDLERPNREVQSLRSKLLHSRCSFVQTATTVRRQSF